MRVNLKEAREKKGFSQKAFSEKIKVPANTYNQYENGERNIPAEIAQVIAKELDVKVDEIFLPLRFTLREQNEEK